MNQIQKSMRLLGLRVRDKVTKHAGIVTSVSFDLYGCIQVIVTPEIDKDGKPGDGRWFDEKRLEILHPDPVMEVPDFAEVPGGQELPSQSRNAL
jgi:hypothetical protein